MRQIFITAVNRAIFFWKKLLFSGKKSVRRDMAYATDYTISEFYDFISEQIKDLECEPNQILLVGRLKNMEEIKRRLQSIPNSVQFLILTPDMHREVIKQKLTAKIKKFPKVVVLLEDDPKFVYNVTGTINKCKSALDTRLIFKSATNPYYETLKKFEGYFKCGDFIDINLDYHLFNQVYKESLELFEQNCQVRDAWDLFQCLTLTKNIPGDLIEIGSYKGHSGWLIERFSQKLFNENKQIYLCDTFESFPVETMGIDKNWSNTHKVDFNQVVNKFKNSNCVTLIKGDIRETLDKISDKTWSFIYLDVDSYSGTLFALEKLYPKLSKGGIVLSQDYGKPHTLGARLAVDEYFQERNVFNYFSFFSGCKVYIKL